MPPAAIHLPCERGCLRSPAMLSPKLSLSCLCNLASSQSLCRLRHVTSRRQYAARSPSVRRAEARWARQPKGPSVAWDPDPDGSRVGLPSTIFLHSARASGILRSDTDDTLEFLKAYINLGPSPSTSRVESLGVSQRP